MILIKKYIFNFFFDITIFFKKNLKLKKEFNLFLKSLKLRYQTRPKPTVPVNLPSSLTKLIRNPNLYSLSFTHLLFPSLLKISSERKFNSLTVVILHIFSETFPFIFSRKNKTKEKKISSFVEECVSLIYHVVWGGWLKRHSLKTHLFLGGNSRFLSLSLSLSPLPISFLTMQNGIFMLRGSFWIYNGGLL